MHREKERREERGLARARETNFRRKKKRTEGLSRFSVLSLASAVLAWSSSRKRSRQSEKSLPRVSRSKFSLQVARSVRRREYRRRSRSIAFVDTARRSQRSIFDLFSFSCSFFLSFLVLDSFVSVLLVLSFLVSPHLLFFLFLLIVLSDLFLVLVFFFLFFLFFVFFFFFVLFLVLFHLTRRNAARLFLGHHHEDSLASDQTRLCR